MQYKYRPGSSLPRREFVVSCRLVFEDGTDGFGSWPVVAPDPVQAYRVVAKHLSALLSDRCKFSVELVREVVKVWHGDSYVKVPTVKVCEV